MESLEKREVFSVTPGLTSAILPGGGGEFRHEHTRPEANAFTTYWYGGAQAASAQASEASPSATFLERSGSEDVHGSPRGCVADHPDAVELIYAAANDSLT